MSHMLADTEEELHTMAANVGLRREWFQHHGTPHYDLCQAKRALALKAGAIEVGRREVVALIKRLRERHNASFSGGPSGPSAASDGSTATRGQDDE